MFSTVSHSTFASALLMNSSAKTIHAASPMNRHLWWHSSQGKIPSKMVRRCLWISNMYTGVVIIIKILIISSSFQLMCSVSASTLYSQRPVDCRSVAPDTFCLHAVNMWSTSQRQAFPNRVSGTLCIKVSRFLYWAQSFCWSHGGGRRASHTGQHDGSPRPSCGQPHRHRWHGARVGRHWKF